MFASLLSEDNPYYQGSDAFDNHFDYSSDESFSSGTLKILNRDQSNEGKLKKEYQEKKNKSNNCSKEIDSNIINLKICTYKKKENICIGDEIEEINRSKKQYNIEIKNEAKKTKKMKLTIKKEENYHIKNKKEKMKKEEKK